MSTHNGEAARRNAREPNSTRKCQHCEGETSPSAGWRVVYRANGIDPDATTRGAIYDPERTERNRRKHRRGVSS